jgi:hypothetical protein
MGGSVSGNLPGKTRPGKNYFDRVEPGNFFAATGTRPKIFRHVPVPAGKNLEQLHPDARDIFRLPGIRPGTPTGNCRNINTLKSCAGNAFSLNIP